MSKAKIEEIAAFAKTHTAKEASDVFHLTLSALYSCARENGFTFVKRKKYNDELLSRITEYGKTHTKKEAYNYFLKEIGEETSYQTFGRQMSICKIKFEKPVRLHPNEANPFNNPNFINAVDEEHLKVNAPKYTCREYIEKFNPPCARTTLLYRMKRLGVEFKKEQTSISEKILNLIEKHSKNLTANQFYEKNCKGICSRTKFYKFIKNNNITFANRAIANPYAYTEEEAYLVKTLYPDMGTQCAKYLPNRNLNSIRNFASRNNIKNIHKVKAKPKIVYDHLGNAYPSVKAMCEHYNISYHTYCWRLYKEEKTKEEALTTPIRVQKRRRLR